MSSVISNDNPLGIIAIDHLEFCCDTLETPTKELFYRFGFSKIAENEERTCELFSQGQVRFVLNSSTTGHSREYLNNHEEGVSMMSFLVENCEHAITEAVKRGAKQVGEIKVEENKNGVFKTAAIEGFGDVLNEFVERPMSQFRPCYTSIETDQSSRPLNVRCSRIDHLTNNVPKGEMAKWVEFYERVYGFKQTRYFDIKGAKTGLESKVVQLVNGNVIIPINEPEVADGKSQIQEFLDRHKGAGVQHIALTTPDIISTVKDLQERDIQFLKIPHTYYEDIPKRGFTVEEDLEVLEERQLLVDGDKEGYLIQNFTDTYVGPLFFEIIQRKNHHGFGEGNFQALFNSIERDQIERGYLE